jgi:hypothetical protein
MRPQKQIRVRKMRQPGRHHGRSTDGPREVYYDPSIRAARKARDRAIGLPAR